MIPMAQANRKTRRKQPATPEQRNAMTFEPLNIKFDLSNDEWVEANLPQIRIALNSDDKELQEKMVRLVRAGTVPEMLEMWCKTKKRLQALAKLCDIALHRSFMVLERLGYDVTIRRLNHPHAC